MSRIDGDPRPSHYIVCHLIRCDIPSRCVFADLDAAFANHRESAVPPHESAILQPSRLGLRTSRSCLTLRVHLGCVRSRLCILGETGIARIPRYTNCAALVLVCSLVVHALQVSLHQERAIVGASHWQFWFLAGGVSGTLTAHDERAVASGHVPYRAEVLVLATKGSRNAQASPHPREATR